MNILPDDLIYPELKAFLNQLVPAASFKQWLDGRELTDVFKTFPNPEDILWLFAKMVDRSGWLTHDQIISLACDSVEFSFSHIVSTDALLYERISKIRQYANGDKSVDIEDNAKYNYPFPSNLLGIFVVNTLAQYATDRNKAFDARLAVQQSIEAATKAAFFAGFANGGALLATSTLASVGAECQIKIRALIFARIGELL